MAKITPEIVDVLRKTAANLEKSTDYQWGHMGACNCGFLAQQITKLSKDQIHLTAMEGCGDWNEQLNDYCPTSGFRMDKLISSMIDFGFDTNDLKNLERLSDREVLQTLEHGERNLSRNVKPHVILYIRQWASLIEQKLLSQIDISSVNDQKEVHISSNP